MTRRGKKRALILLGGVVLCGVVLASLYVLRETQITRMRASARVEGMTAYNNGDWPVAIKKLGYYLGRNKQDTEALHAVAVALQNSPREKNAHLVSAIKHASAASEVEPLDTSHLELLLELYSKIGYLREAEHTADKLLDIEPDHREALLMMVEAARLKGRSQEALAAAQSMIEHYPEDIIAHNFAVGFMQDLSYTNAEIRTYVDDLVQKHPDNVELALLRVKALMTDPERTSEEEVLAALDDIANSNIESGPALLQLIQILDAVGEGTLADDAIARTLQASGDATWAVIVAAERAWKNGDVDEAGRIIRRADTGQLADADENLLGWKLFLAEDDVDLESPLYAELERRETRNAASWTRILRARVEMSRAEWGQARDLLGAVLEETPANQLARFMLGGVEQAVGEWRSAKQHWTTVAREQPSWLAPQVALVSLLIEHGLYDEADRIAQLAGAYHRRNSKAAWTLAQTSVHLLEDQKLAPERAEQLRAFVASVLESTNAPGEPLALLARIEIATGDLPAAQQTITKIIDQKPELSTETALRLSTLCERHTLDGREDILALAISEDPDDPRPLFVEAKQAAAAGRPADGRRLLERAVRSRAPDARKPFERVLAIYLDRIGAPDAARKLSEFAAAYPDDPRAQRVLLDASTPWQSSDATVVSKAIERLRAINGEESSSWRLYEVRRFLVFDRSSRDAARYVELLAETVRREPENASALISIADLLLVANPDDPAPAIEYMSKAVDAFPARADLLADLARMLLRSGDTAEARRRLRQLALFDQLEPSMREARAELLWHGGMIDEAIADLEDLGDSASPELRVKLAHMLISKGRVDDAHAIIDQIVESEPSDPELIALVASLLASQGEIDRGAQLFAREQGPREYQIAKARYVNRYVDPRRGEELLREQIKRDDTPELWLELIHLRMKAPDANAGSVLAEAERAHPGDVRIQAVRTIVDISAADSDSPINVPEPFVSALLDPSQTIPAIELVEAIRERRATGDNEAFATRVSDLTARFPGFYIGWHTLAAAKAESGDYNGAVDTATRTAQIFPWDPRPLRIAVSLLSEQRRFNEASMAATQWRERSLADPYEAEITLADLANARGKPDEALRWLRPHRDRIVNEAARFPSRFELLVSALAYAGDVDEAHELMAPLAEKDLEMARAYLRIGRGLAVGVDRRAQWLRYIEPRLLGDPEDRLDVGQAWFDLATGFGRAEDHDHILEVVGPALDIPATSGRAHLLAAMSNDQRGRYAQSEEHFRAALRAMPDHPVVLNYLADLLLRHGDDPQETSQLAQRAVDTANERGRAPTSFLDTLGYAQLAADALADARRTFEAGIERDPTDARLRAGLAVATDLIGDADGAERSLTGILSPDVREQAILSTARYFEVQGKLPRAARYYKLVADASPDNFVAMNNLAYVMHQLDDDPDEAMRLSSRAVDVARSRQVAPAIMATLLDTLGLTARRAGESEVAERSLREGLEQNPDNIRLLVGLAELLEAEGRTTELNDTLSAIDALIQAGATMEDGLAERLGNIRG